MKTEKNILIAFILNLSFSVFEFLGGIYTGSVAIMSDAMHDIGDALSIGLSYFLEKKSKKQPDSTHTYGYLRYSVLGSVVTTLILLAGSVIVIYNAINRIIFQTEIKYNTMIIFAVIGVCVNSCAAVFTRDGNSLNQKAVNLHMLEDVLGWIIVLIGAFVMKFTDLVIIDPIMSIVLSAFIIVNAVKNLKEAIDIFLEKTPTGINIEEIKEHILKVDGVIDVHHIHLWTMDGQNNYATMHIVTDGENHKIKDEIRRELENHMINHITLELEKEGEHCHEKLCKTNSKGAYEHHHHHLHHHTKESVKVFL